MKPTGEQFTAFQAMYDHFNRTLFGGELPSVMLNLSRVGRRVRGFFAPERWDNGAIVAHEISLNPSHLRGREPIDVASTLVHEMTHLWQQERGKPSRSGYHNAEWGTRMESLGLVPSNTGQPGGRKVGQSMSHYIVDNGPFALAFAALDPAQLLPWQSAENAVEAQRGERNKGRFVCPGCGQRAWGKPGLHVICGDCGEPLRAA